MKTTRRAFLTAAIFFATLAVSTATASSTRSVYAIKDAKIYPVSGPAIDRGVIVIRNGLIEAVGANFLDVYFRSCARLLKPEGAMLLQAITIQDQYYQQALKSVDYIQRYVFPGSFIPSIEALSKSLAKATDFKIFHLEDIGPHYARTLRMWRERFFRNLGKVRELGYNDSFVRLWEYYLCYCEGGFMERQLGTVQMLLTKPGCRRAPLPMF